MSDSNLPNPNELPPLDLSAVDKELRNEAKYGGKPIEAALGSAASAATFGLSDIALTEAGVSPERLREVRDREAAASLLGTTAGIVGPALATLGTSTAASAASAGIKGVTAAGRAAEVAAAKVLAPRVGEAAAGIIGKGVAGATEGALAGAGQLASDVVLERKDLSAESAMATVGAGALFGGGFGLALGTAQATLPSAVSKVGRLSKKLDNFGSEAIQSVTDPVEASLRVTSDTAAKRLALRESLGSSADYLPTYLQEKLGLEITSTPGQLYKANKAAVQEAGESIGALSKRLDELTAEGVVPVSRAEAYQPIVNKVKELLGAINPELRAAKPQLRILRNYMDDVVAMATKDAPFSFSELDDYRKFLQTKSYSRVGALENAEAKVADALRAEIRNSIDSMAVKASQAEPGLSTALQKANQDYHVGSTLNKYLKATANNAPGIGSLTEFISKTTGRVARNAAVVTDVANRTSKVIEAANSAVDKFFKTGAAFGAQKAVLPTGLASSKVLLSSGFASDPSTGKLPKTKDQAFNNVQKNVTDLQSNPEKLVELIAVKTARIANADAGVAGAMQSTLASSIAFLSQKLPKPTLQTGLFPRPYRPSSMEMAKFERYMQIIEKPLTALDDLENSTLTREHVEALKAVYPEIYGVIQQRAIDHITNGTPMPYSKKVQLGILLDIPADSSLTGAAVMNLQQTFSPPEEGGDVSPTVTGLQDLNTSNRAETAVQNLQASE